MFFLKSRVTWKRSGNLLMNKILKYNFFWMKLGSRSQGYDFELRYSEFKKIISQKYVIFSIYENSLNFL